MKTIIYLPLIALIILCGCKSSSFTTQRYTKFGHASHKKQIHEPVVKATAPKEIKETKVETETVKAKVTPVTIITSGVSALKEAILKPQTKHSKSISASVALENSAAPVYSEKTNITNDIKSNFNSKKQVKHEGLIGSAFLTALWIVLVVIFIFLIIFLLSAIF